MATVYDVRQKLTAEVLKEIESIGNGGCLAPEANAETVAMNYRQRLGFVEGLRHALTVVDELERESQR